MTTRTAITLLNNAETEELLGIKPKPLEICRIKGTGPAYRIGMIDEIDLLAATP